MNVPGEYDAEAFLKAFLKVLEGLFVAFLAFIAGNFLALLSLGFASTLGFDGPLVQIPLTIVTIQGVAFGGIALAYLYARNLGIEFLNLRRPSLRDVAWVVLGFGLLLITAFVAAQFFREAGIESARNVVQEQGEEAPVVFLVLIPLSFLLVGPGEELLFRGLIQGSLRESFSPAAAIGVASLIFAVAHFPSLIGQGSRLVYIAIIFALSVILGAAYERTDNLVVPAVIHGGYNAFLFLGMYLQATGMLPTG